MTSKRSGGGAEEGWLYRKCPQDNIGTGARLEKIKGKTLAWNQLVPNGNFVNLVGWNYPGERVSVANNIVTINFDAQYSALWRNINVISGHKYYISLEAKPTQTSDLSFRYGIGGGGYFSGEGVVLSLSANSISSTTTFTRLSTVGIFTKSSSDTGNSGIYLMKFGGAAQDVQVKNLMVFDLTQMFSAGNEPATIEEFEALFPNSYYNDYEPGKLISNDAESIKTVGFNQWDEEWENAYYPNGVKTDSSISLGSKNLVPVLHGQTYFFKVPNPDDQIFVCYYDANGNYISGHSDYTDSGRVVVPKATRLLTVPANVNYIRFSYYTGSTITYNHDICINFSDPTKNGIYKPYRKSVMQLNLDSFQVRDSQGNVITIAGGLKSAGSVYDEIVGNKYIKRVGSVDLGSLNYSVVDASKGIFITSRPADSKTNVAAVICAKYTYQSNGGFSVNDKCLADAYGAVYERTWIIKDSALINKTAAEIKAALSGVMIDYILATPVEYELVDAIPYITQYSEYGTQRIISPQSSTPSVPFYGEWQYGIQQGDFISGLENSEFMIGSFSYIISEEEFNEIFGNL